MSKIRRYLPLIALICNLLISVMISYAGVVLIKSGDTNGYFVICIGLQFFILRINRREVRQDGN